MSQPFQPDLAIQGFGAFAKIKTGNRRLAMSVLHHHPRLHFQISPELTIVIMTVLLLMLALWLVSLISFQPRERAVPHPVIAKEISEPFYWIK